MESKLLISSLMFLACGLLQAQDKSDNTSFNLFGGDSSGSKSKGPTIITATQGASFDSKNHTGNFIGNVQVQDPQFSMTCDKLTVFMNKEGGGLKRAEADGNVFIVSIRKAKPAVTPAASPGTHPVATPTPSASPAPDAPDEKSTGKGTHATYTTIDGQITLTGSPQVQQRGNTHIATDPGTIMHLFNDGRLETQGPSRTIIKNNSSDTTSPTPNDAPQ